MTTDLRGKAMLIDFWLSGSEPRLAEMPGLDAVYRRYGDKGLENLAVNPGQSRAEFDAAAALASSFR